MSCDRPAVVCALGALSVFAGSLAAQDPWADEVVSYVPGGDVGAYDVPEVALGSPTRFTGADIFPGVVSPFNSAWVPDEIVSIASGGELVVRFDEPVQDDPANPFGIDLLVFSNAFFIDASYPSGVIGGLFDDGGTIEVSPDGITWHEVPAVGASSLFPTLGYLDAGPYDTLAGELETDFTVPVDPALGLADLDGMAYEQLVEAYGRSGGGAPVDLASVGLEYVSYVRIRSTGATLEIDAMSDVRAELAGDVNGDGVVDFADLIELLASWGACAGCPADFDHSGTVDFDDLITLLAAWTT